MKKLALKLGGNVLTKNQMQNISGGDGDCGSGCSCYCQDSEGNPEFVGCSGDYSNCSLYCTISLGKPFQYCTDW